MIGKPKFRLINAYIICVWEFRDQVKPHIGTVSLNINCQEFCAFAKCSHYLRRNQAVPEVSSGLTFGVEAEIARQTDQGANPTSFALTYALLRPAVRWNDMTTLSIGWEHLGGNGVAAVQSPLATLHRHNGWADVFTTTPVNGLRDVHLRVMQELPDVGFLSNPRIDFRYHDFRATRGGSHYGTEWDVDVNFSVLSRATLGLRYAAYNAKRFDSDTEKLWLYLEFQY